MKQLFIKNPQNKKMASTSRLVMRLMQNYKTKAEKDEVEVLLEEHENSGIILTLDDTELASYTFYHLMMMERLSIKDKK